MRLVKSFIFLLLVACLVGLLMVIQNWEDQPVQVSIQDQLSLAEQSDSLIRSDVLDSQSLVHTFPVSALFEDYEARMEHGFIRVTQSNRLLGNYEVKKLAIRQLILADLNGDDMPECWVLGHKPSKQVEIFALEFKSGHSKRINFPTLKGSQAFGYVGGDSLYLEKTTIARQFNFAHDPYADVESGKRVCFYQYGKDQSFVLKKTIDLE